VGGDVVLGHLLAVHRTPIHSLPGVLPVALLLADGVTLPQRVVGYLPMLPRGRGAPTNRVVQADQVTTRVPDIPACWCPGTEQKNS